MHTAHLQVKNISKNFGRRRILSDISLSLTNPASFAIAGRNGSGKSTFVKILAGLLSPTSGSVELHVDGNVVMPGLLHLHIGFVSPYLQLYDEFTGKENLHTLSRIRKVPYEHSLVDQLLERLGLYLRRDDYVRTYSSGMKQRLKYAFALLHNPPMLILDEPGSNLDEEGKGIVEQIMQEQRQRGILIVATNERSEIRLCEAVLELHGADVATEPIRSISPPR